MLRFKGYKDCCCRRCSCLRGAGCPPVPSPADTEADVSADKSTKERVDMRKQLRSETERLLRKSCWIMKQCSGALQTRLFLIETDLWNVCGMATPGWPLCNIYGCRSAVCKWSEITPYLFSPGTLPVNRTSLPSPLAEVVIQDAQGENSAGRTARTGAEVVGPLARRSSLHGFGRDASRFCSERRPGCFFDSLNECFCFVESQHFVLICCSSGRFGGKPQTKTGVKPLEGDA